MVSCVFNEKPECDIMHILRHSCVRNVVTTLERGVMLRCIRSVRFEDSLKLY